MANITIEASVMGKIKRIRNFYIPWLSEEEKHSKKLAWESDYNQQIRFKVLTDNIDLESKSILDVGCGLGDLLSFLTEQGINVKYTGVDVLSEMIDSAKKFHPKSDFYKINIFKDDISNLGQYDVIYASGTFNLNLQNNYDFLSNVTETFLKLANKYFIFNLLHERSTDKDRTFFYTTPEKIVPLFENKKCSVRIVDDYLENDFSVIGEKI